MKKYLSSKLLIFTLRENWLPFAIVSVLGVLSTLIVNSINFAFADTVIILNIASVSPILRSIPMLLIPFAVKAFGFYMKRCESDFYESLPYTRIQVLFSVTAALSLLSIGALTVTALGSYAVSLEHIKSHVFLMRDSFLLLVAYVIACEISIFGTAVAVSVTGHTVNAMIASALLLYMPRWAVDTVASFAESSPLLSDRIEIFKNQFNVLTMQPMEAPKLSAYIYSLVLAILMALAAIFFFKRRKSEIATSFYGSSVVGHILRAAISLPFAFLFIGQFTRLGEDNFVAVAAAMLFSLVLLFAVYFGYELVAVKNKRAFVSALRGLPILIGASAVILTVGLSSGAIASSHVPDAESIRYVKVVSTDSYYGALGADLNMQQYAERRLTNLRLDDEESRKIIADAIRENTEAYENGDFDKKYYYSNQKYVNTVVEVGTGFGSFRRNLMLSVEHADRLNELLAQHNEYRHAWTDLPDTPYAVMHNSGTMVALSREDAELAYEALLRDVSRMTYEEWYDANAYGSYNSLTVVIVEDGDAYKLELPVSAATPEANDFINAKMAALVAKSHQDMLSLVNSAMNGERTLEISINVCTQDSEQFSWFILDDSAEGRAVGELVKAITLPKTPSNDGYVVIGLWRSDTAGYQYYEFALSDAYSMEEIKQFFNEEMSK